MNLEISQASWPDPRHITIFLLSSFRDVEIPGLLANGRKGHIIVNIVIMKAAIIRYLESLRFPVLLIVTAIIFLVNVFVPDMVPFIDELLLALVVALLARLKRRGPESRVEQEDNDIVR
jgi:hypothetical protein